jgi:heme/copper-type cytochrome/quinol oxidase subunit 2
VVASVLAALSAGAVHAAVQARREFTVSARKYAYTVSGANGAEIRVQVNDLVKITLEAEDIPHSLTIDEYRISRRAEPGKPTVIEFRADKPGTFAMYCDLMIDPRCRKETRGTLVVSER